METTKKLNSTEIARLAGVSRSTVSRVVNGYSNVPEETRQRVMKVIHENDYFPSFSGQVLAGKRTETLGFFCVARGTIANDIQFSAYTAHVLESAAALGYLVLICIVKNLDDEKNINQIKRIFMQDRVDAGIFIGVNNNEPLVEELIARGKIVGIFDHFHSDRNEPNRISVNYEIDTGKKVIDYVCSLGHKKIAIIDGDMNRFCLVKRHEGFITGMQEHNIEMRRAWMYYSSSVGHEGYQEMKDLLAHCSELPTVVCAYNDSAAFGVYKAIEEAGLRVGEDISVIGIDGHEKANLVVPHLTSFSFNYQEIFYSLVSRTIGVVQGKRNVPSTLFFTSTLIERESVKNFNE